ncbi:Glycosyltransferase, DXD sugar-binding motif protein [Metarhizium album ARSEF 1941]|uniref:Glycosyltransferase, DXD sugar-binding motif protein n=1 Tax=Metarhizium album (strain ARSEF 1941) TaxID=1081103 RepID=A0A0B2WKQ9_METAS|nr:Glycosyltransferase, DXD sugar-binding motif protein [Metarhizium album ARSEF 1941]KHN94072.1 Glycosyltransferase, DXD sugar-binding motif protein [Metarhizium album ARSEF 1941]
MRAGIWRSSRRLVAVLVLSLAAIVVLHQLSFNDAFLLCGRISESIEIVEACARPDAGTTGTTGTNGSSTAAADSRIPNIVHQIWKTDNVLTYSAEASLASWRAKVEVMNYTVKLWTDKDVRRLVETEYPWLSSTYEGYALDIQRADLARLVVVHAEGGIYADLDVYPGAAEELTCLRHVGLRGIFAPTSGALGLSNHFFMAERGSEFLRWALYEAKRRGGSPSRRILLPYLRVFWSTGPLMVTSAFRQYSWMYGASDHELGVLGASYGRTVIRHAAGRSWHGVDGYVLNWVADRVRAESLRVGVYVVIAVVLLVSVLWRCRWRKGRR